MFTFGNLLQACSLLLASSVTMGVAAADDAPTVRFGLGGYLHGQYDAVLSMIGEQSYAYDVGAMAWPNAEARAVDYPSDPRTLLRYDHNVAIGVNYLGEAVEEELAANPDAVVGIAGVSMGSIVIDHLLAEWADDPDAPKQLKVTVYADPQRGLLRLLPDDITLPGYVNVPIPETQYDITAVNSEYDGFSDPPDRPWNLLATANAVAGAWYLHGTEIYADLDDVPAENIASTVNSKGGRTTTYVVPARQLPLTMPLRALMPHTIVDQIDELVKPVIDRGYSRHDEPGDDRPILRGGRIVNGDDDASSDGEDRLVVDRGTHGQTRLDAGDGKSQRSLAGGTKDKSSPKEDRHKRSRK